MQEQTVVLHGYLAVLNAEADLAAVAVTALRDAPIPEWTRAFDVHPEWRSFGPLNALLEIAHKHLDNDARRSADIAAFVLAQAQHMTVSDNADLLRPLLVGTALKEQANALYELGEYDAGLAPICRAIDLFQQEPAFAVDRAAALLTYAQIAHELKETAAALEAVREASSVFFAHRETERYLQALEICGYILFDQTEYALALDAYQTARTVAERLNDAYAIARTELNLGQTSIFLEQLDEATHYLARALTYFEEQRMQGAVYRVVHGLALVGRERGEFDEALEALHRVYGELLDRGRHRAAAAVLVDLCDTVTELTGDAAYARETCRQLEQTMGKYDAPSNVRDAVQYLRRQMEGDSLPIIRAAFAYVRGFLDALLGSPSTAFAVALT